MELLHYLRIQARANRLANHRLHAAMAALTREDFHAPRTSFFPTLAKTLNHILAVDLYYIGALHGELNDGSPYSGIRFVDRFTVRDGRLVDQMVWNDMAEVLGKLG